MASEWKIMVDKLALFTTAANKTGEERKRQRDQMSPKGHSSMSHLNKLKSMLY